MSSHDPEDYRRTADEVLSRPEFAEEVPSLPQRALDWVFEQLGRFLGAVIGSSGGYLIGYLILGVAAAVAVYLVWKFYPRGRLRPPRQPDPIQRETTSRRSRAEWLARAEAAEAAGDHESAVHARYHALTAGLADDEVVPASESTTSGEHRRAFARSAAARPSDLERFDSATDRYEEVVFGGDDAGADDSAALAVLDRDLLSGRR